jgi:N-acetylglutamate synthase-like GNAT family acetyltransferase
MEHVIQYREADNTFSSRIVELVLTIQQKEFNVPVTLEDQPDLLAIEENYHRSGGSFWVAMDGDVVVGSIALIVFDKDKGALRKMFVKQGYRGKTNGIAAQLLRLLLQYCREKGVRDVYLGTVDMLKAAHRFYEKNGFERIEKKAIPAGFPFMQADTLFYHLALQEK